MILPNRHFLAGNANLVPSAFFLILLSSSFFVVIFKGRFLISVKLAFTGFINVYRRKMFNELFFAISNINWKQLCRLSFLYFFNQRMFVKYVFKIILRYRRTKTELMTGLVNLNTAVFFVVLGIYAALAYLPQPPTRICSCLNSSVR